MDNAKLTPVKTSELDIRTLIVAGLACLTDAAYEGRIDIDSEDPSLTEQALRLYQGGDFVQDVTDLIRRLRQNPRYVLCEEDALGNVYRLSE